MRKKYQYILLLKARYDKLAKGKGALLQMISEAEIGEQVYNSNAIENSTLSLDETERILRRINLDRIISQRELFEAKNLANVISYINERGFVKKLDKRFILFLHKMLLSNISDDFAGRFRNEKEWVRVGNHIACDPLQIDRRMKNVLTTYQKKKGQSILERLAYFHLEFEHIHPFCDGNGRIGRVLNNLLLRQAGFVPINIKFVDRSQYYKCFVEYGSMAKTRLMQEVIRLALSNSYHKRLAYLEGKEIITLQEYCSLTKQSHSNAINKAHRQTIEAFTQKGIWKIGV